MPLKRSLRAILIFLSALPVVAHATGDERGNGGGVVVCRNSAQEITSVELLDFYEARVLRKIQRDLGAANLSYHEKIDYVLGRRAKIAPVRTSWWGDTAKTFEENANFLPNTILTHIPDDLISAYPKGCAVEQIVIQKEPMFPEDKLYTVSKDLWDMLDADNKAGLILHEVIYHEALLYGHENSINARYVNSMWTAAGDPSYFVSQDALNNLFRLAHFGAGEVTGNAPMLYPCDGVYMTSIRWEKPLDAAHLASVEQSFLPRVDRIFVTPLGEIKLTEIGTYQLGLCATGSSGDLEVTRDTEGRVTEVSNGPSNTVVGNAAYSEDGNQLFAVSLRVGANDSNVFSSNGNYDFSLTGKGWVIVNNQKFEFENDPDNYGWVAGLTCREFLYHYQC